MAKISFGGRSEEGADISMNGRKHSEETKRKISEARKKYRREKHPGWKGGRRKTSKGYIELLQPDHPRARGNGYVFEHIIVAEEKIGRSISQNEIVHHKNHNKTDNSPENLEVLDRGDHTVLHSKERRKGRYVACFICGEVIYRKPSHLKERNFCSQHCAGKASNIGSLNKKVSDEEIMSLLKQRITLKKAAEQLGVSRSTISRRFKKIKGDSCDE